VPKNPIPSEIPSLRQPAGIPADVPVRPLTNLGRSRFGFQLARALHAARGAGHVTEETQDAISERLIWIRIKHESIAVFAQRVREEWALVREIALNAEPDDVGYTLNVGRTQAITLTADLEGLIVFLRATLNGVVTLVHAVERDVLAQPLTPAAQLWTLPGVEPTVQTLVQEARHGFAHGQAAWPEVLLTPGRPDLLIASRLRPDYAAGEGYVLLTQVLQWWGALEQHLDCRRGFARGAHTGARVNERLVCPGPPGNDGASRALVRPSGSAQHRT